MESGSFQIHVNVHRRVRTKHTSAICSLKQTKLGQAHHIVVDTLDITANHTR